MPYDPANPGDPNTPNHPYYKRLNHVKLPRNEMCCRFFAADADIPGGGGGPTPPDNEDTYEYAAVVNVDIPIIDTSKHNKVKVKGKFSQSTRILLRVTTDNFATVKTTDYAYNNWNVGPHSASNLNGAPFIELGTDYLANSNFDLKLELMNLAAARYTFVQVDGGTYIRATGGAPRSIIGGGIWRQNTLVNGIRIYGEAGTFTGEVTVSYGV